MKTFIITVRTVCFETHSVIAKNKTDAELFYEEGKATLDSDEINDSQIVSIRRAKP